MAHDNQHKFCLMVKDIYSQYFEEKSVLDVGSMDINGNNRVYFHNCEYTGLDIAAGNNVNVVCGIEWYQTDEKFDVIISTEMVEHCENWRDALMQMYYFLKSGGLLLITCAGDGRSEHGTYGNQEWASPHTLNYYHNVSNKMFGSALEPEMFKTYYLNNDNEDLQFYGIKK